MIPIIEELGNDGWWKYHCNNYYSHPFFHTLCLGNAYELRKQLVADELLCVCLQKTEDRSFMEDRSAFLRGIVRTEGGVIYSGINDSGTITAGRRAMFSLLRLEHHLRVTIRHRFAHDR